MEVWYSLQSWFLDHWDELLIALGIILLAIILRKIFAKYIFKIILKIVNTERTELLHKFLMAFERPFRWFIVVLGAYIAYRYLPMPNQFDDDVVNVFRSFIIVLITWGLCNFSASSSILFTKLTDRFNFEVDRIIAPFLSKVIRFVIIAISISILAQEWGYNVNGFVAGLGLGGLAFALAAKDTIGNLFGGIVIILEKPFSIGDWIKTPQVEGTVEDISFRSSKVRTFAQALVTLPNATLANTWIMNWSKMGKRRISFHLGLTYDTSRDQIQSCVDKIENMLRSHDDIHPETIMVKFETFNSSSLDLFLYFFTKTTEWEEYLNVRQDVNLKIMKILEDENVNIAFPTRMLHINNEYPEELTHESKTPEV